MEFLGKKVKLTKQKKTNSGTFLELEKNESLENQTGLDESVSPDELLAFLSSKADISSPVKEDNFQTDEPTIDKLLEIKMKKVVEEVIENKLPQIISKIVAELKK